MSDGSTALYEVSLDPGNWGGKAVREDREVIIRNSAVPYDGSDDELQALSLFGEGMDEVTFSNGEPLTESARIGFAGKQWLVGALAEQQMLRTRQRTGYGRYGTPEWNALIAALLVKLYSKRSGSVALTLSIPVSQIKAKKAGAIVQDIVGMWEVEHEGKNLAYEVREDMIDIVPEGFGSLVYLCVSESGKSFTDRDLAGSRVVVFDFGGYTLDIMTYLSLKKGPYNESLDTGLLHIRNQVERGLMHRYNRGRMTSSNVDKVIRTERYRHAGGPEEDVSDIVEPAVVNLMQEALRVWHEDLGSGADFDTVVLSGGGGPTIGPLLQPQLGHHDVRTIHTGEAHVANVRGGLRYRKFKRLYTGS